MTFEFNLQLFAEGGSEGGSASEGTASAESNQNILSLGNSKSKNPLANVRYGTQPEDSATDSDGSKNSKNENRDADFEALIKGEYKEQFDKRTQGIIDKRFKETKTLERYKNDTAPVIDMLYQKYGVSDIKSLTDALNKDNAWVEQAAENEGLTVEQYEQKQRLERENAQFKRMLENQQREQAVQAQLQRWEQEAAQLRTLYPNFDLNTESQNAVFIDLLGKGVTMQAAYEVTHLNDIKMGVAQATQQTVANSVRANGLRPTENGVTARTGVTTKSDVSKLNKADRAEIARRVRRGEIIRFGR